MEITVTYIGIGRYLSKWVSKYNIQKQTQYYKINRYLQAEEINYYFLPMPNIDFKIILIQFLLFKQAIKKY